MAGKTVAPYGAWRSPLGAALVSSASVWLDALTLEDEQLYWTEMRPEEDGRTVVVRWAPDDVAAAGSPVDVTPPGFSVRTRVHEYGGGAYWVDGEVIYFANAADQILYMQAPGAAPRPLTPPGYRYADGIVDRRRQRLICVREDHTRSGAEAANTIVAIDLAAGGAGAIIASGHDFYATPRLSPDGAALCWLAWNHPNMPWMATELWVADVAADGAVENARCIAGGQSAESIFQPQWAPDGRLYFVSDRSGWWNLYRAVGADAQAILPMDAEFGLPQWVFNMSTYGFLDAQTIYATYAQQGLSHLVRIDLARGSGTVIDLPWSHLDNLRVGKPGVVFIGGSPQELPAVVRLDPLTGAAGVLRRSGELEIDEGFLSTPETIDFPTVGEAVGHAFYYPPRNAQFAAPVDEKPPLIVMSHGGPTAAAANTLALGIQFWTSRGFAVLDVNYGGSTGYGRAYRQRLDGAWGVVDVDDCIAGARCLVEQGRVDGRRLVIRGGSAGGYTTLMALTTRREFRAGASYYGLSELEAFARDTHKFESRYLDSLIGPYPARRELYVERSPLTHVDALNCPVIFFQGWEDKIVPPSQAEMMVDALRKKDIPVAYSTYEGEDHGFRQARHQIHSRESELYFYGRILGFTPADELEPVTIENLD